MLRYLANENFHGDIVRGLRRRSSQIDIARVQDVGLSGADDPTVLGWAASERRNLLTHDVTTITRYAYDRIREGLSMPGVFEVNRTVPVGVAISDLLLLAECSLPDEWEAQILSLPV